jgi:N-methylhydantoinase A
VSRSKPTIVGVDVGGTFTDFFCYDKVTRDLRIAKFPSHRGDEAVGFLDGLGELGGAGTAGAIVHGTTVATNALIERTGARVGIITTKGFRDVIEMRRRDRRHTWGLWGDFEPVVARDLRLEVEERTLSNGTVRTPVDPSAVRAAARELIARGAEALAIAFINSYANATNEHAALAAASQVWPNDHLACSSRILPEIREFERTSTTALNAYLQPVVGRYLGKLEAALSRSDFRGSLHIVQSNGGVMSTATARELPVRTALSGPAAGVIAATAIARAAGYSNAITCDLGGTSFDVSLVSDGAPTLAAEATIDFGLVIRTPMIEILTIGAGGGAIAQVDETGLLQVGPHSAGSRPGPVCYGAGNSRPTLTDADLVLGRINAERPIGGALERLDVTAARAAIEKEIGRPLDLRAMTAAEAIVRVADAKMAAAIRLVSIERGHDPGKFVAVAFGGAGALHVGALIKDVGLSAALVPRLPGVTSALGCVMADVRHDRVRTINLMLDGLDAAAFERRLIEEAQAARAVVAAAGLDMTTIEVLFALDMHYVGQTHTVSVPLALGVAGRATWMSEEIVRAAFERAYLSAFSRLLPGMPVKIVSLKTTAIGLRPKFDLSSLAPQRDAAIEAAYSGKRPVWFADGWRDTAIWSRLDLPVGALIEGPAVLEQPDATTLVDPNLCAGVDRFGNLRIERKP